MGNIDELSIKSAYKLEIYIYFKATAYLKFKLTFFLTLMFLSYIAAFHTAGKAHHLMLFPFACISELVLWCLVLLKQEPGLSGKCQPIALLDGPLQLTYRPQLYLQGRK